MFNDSVVQDDLEERVLGKLASEADGDRPAADDVTALAGMRVATPPGIQVSHQREVHGTPG